MPLNVISQSPGGDMTPGPRHHAARSDSTTTRRRGRRLAAATLAATAVLGVVACSSDSDGASSTTSTAAPTGGGDSTGSSADLSGPGTSNGDLPYADSGWVTLHGDAGNRKYQPTATVADSYTDWQALDHQSVLAAPASGTDGQLFVATGRAAGSSNLHAFDIDGELLWESEPWSGTTGVDSCAVLSTPIVDTEGDLYVSDCDQLWAYRPDGELKWVAELPAAPADSPFATNPLHPNNLLTAFFTLDGDVAGVTLFGQVVTFDRADGTPLGEPLQLPSVPSTRSEDPPTPPTMFSEGEMDPDMKDVMWQVAFGGSVVSANTPAVSADTGRVFVVAGADDPENGVVYGLDIDAGEVTIAFTTPVGVGSGCSPTLSPDNAYAYTCDAAGTLYSIDTEDGSIQWSVDAQSEAGSVAVAADGSIYVLVRNGTYAAYSPDGEKLWDADFSTIEDPLPENPAIGEKKLVGGGNPTVVDEGRALVVALNRTHVYAVAGKTPNVPIIAELVELDAVTGKATRTITRLANPTEGILHVGPDGTIVSTQGGIYTTSLAPLAAPVNALLTDGLTVIPAGGGIQIFRPEG
jgi:PQQ-like domain